MPVQEKTNDKTMYLVYSHLGLYMPRLFNLISSKRDDLYNSVSVHVPNPDLTTDRVSLLDH